jgi:hypothetical protein
MYGFNPITPPTLAIPHNPNTIDWIRRINDIHIFIVEQLKTAKVLQSHYANKRRVDRTFNVGQMVMLDTTNLTIRNQLTTKFKQRFIGPYPITKVISPTSYELQLPGTMNIHPIFHISKLKLSNNPTAPMDIVPTMNEITEEYQVQKVLDFKVDVCPSKYKRGPCLLFLVRWSPPYTSHDDSWEPHILLKNVDALHEFVRTNSRFKEFMKSQEYIELTRRYKARFPTTF